ncbi:subclass B3 metallo-beta-lactamase [Sphingomonas sp. G-3-2-10]|nr:subclass B3 metallo-beta-lactamase [Sphingomonas sp. G-3-2-10]
MRALALMLPILLAGAAPAHDGQDAWAEQRREWNVPAEPFRIAGNVWFVGTEGLSAFLITDPKGHVLIDGGLPESAPLILANIAKLGFKAKDVRYLLINHAHFDHSGGLAEIRKATGATLMVSEGDRRDIERGRTLGRTDLLGFPPVKVDRVIGEGTHIRIGATDLTTHLTPGHTRGCTSWSMKVTEAGRTLDVLFACSLTVAGRVLTPAAESEFLDTFAALGRMRADIFLNFHPGAFGMEAKRARLAAGDPFAFVAPEELGQRVAAARMGFETELARQRAALKK